MKKLISVDEATLATKQLSNPCSDCPMRRDSLMGWLGGYTAREYANICHSDLVVDCHTQIGSRCAGVSIYRRNTCKWEPEDHRLPANREIVFSNIMEFMEHHNKLEQE